jgi:hypothetical protein
MTKHAQAIQEELGAFLLKEVISPEGEYHYG